MIAKWKEAHPSKELPTPAIDDDKTDYAYSLALTLESGNDDDEDGPSGRYRGGRRGQPTISMEDLNVLASRTSMAPESVLEEGLVGADVPVKHLIIDCSEVCFIDVTGVGILKKCQEECDGIGVELLLASTNSELLK